MRREAWESTAAQAAAGSESADGLACYRANKNQSDKNSVGSFTWTDNTNSA